MTALWEILVPTIRNGKPVRTRHHREWDKFVRSLSGGLTLMRPTKGQWLCPASKKLVEERMIPVRIACTKSDIQKIMLFTKRHYDQDLVMAYRLSEEVLFS